MKKSLSIILIVICNLCILCACQATPEKDVVIGKDVDKMLEKAMESDPEKADTIIFPEKFECEISECDGNFTITADAEVIAPDNLFSLPTVRTQGREFSQEEVTKIFKYLFTDQVAYSMTDQNNTATKADIQATMIALEQAIAFGRNGEALTEDEISEYREQIEQLKKDYEVAPDKSDGTKISDGILTESKYLGKSGKRLHVQDDVQKQDLDIWSSSENDSFIHYTTDRVYAVYDSANLMRDAETEIPQNLISYEDAAK